MMLLKFSGAIFGKRLKQENGATSNDLNTVKQRAIRNEEKIEKLQTFDLSYFLVKIVLVIMIFKKCLFIKQHLIR